jgi:threonine synthase
MKYVKNYECTICHKTYPKDEEMMTCTVCGEKGILDINFDYELLKKDITKEYFEQNTDYSIWRYLPFLPLRETDFSNTLHVGWTPLYEANNINKDLRVKKLYIKDEGVNPTASLKDRASAVAVMKALELDKKIISCSSTGNAASSLAGNAARMGLKTVIFVPKRAPIGKLTQLLVYGATVVSVNGDYKDAFQLSKEAIDHYGWYNRNAAINPILVEGKKTVALEIAEQLDFNLTDWVAVSVGDGCTIAGVYKGFKDLYEIGLIDQIPKLLGVQSEGCAPFYEAYQEHRPIEETEENTIADSIAVGIPRNPLKAMNAVKQSSGTWITVTDDEILESIKYLGHKEGLFGEPAGVTGLAGTKKAIKEGIIKETESVTVIMTGNGLKDTVNGSKAVNEPIKLDPNLKDLIKIIDGVK